MTWTPAPLPQTATARCPALETVIVPRARDIGGFEVRRALPATERQMVGPFIFFDQMGPASFGVDQGIDVRPHPHIGLATVTYLYQGGLFHRDSLGNALEIRPGAVNWMTAGRGITHSERTAPERRHGGETLYGLQTWVALPDAFEDTDPAFEHFSKDDLPTIEADGVTLRLILGSLFGKRAPVRTYSEMFYADTQLTPGATIELPTEHEDRAIYVVEGTIEIAGERHGAGRLLVFRPEDAIAVHAVTPTRLMLLGGETFGEPRYIWWNFVASSRERIEDAKQAWASENWSEGRFRLPPDDDREHIPLPR